MAADLTGNPWTFDGTTQVGPTGVRPYIKSILFTTGAAGGAVEVLDKAAGRSLTGAIVMAANDRCQPAIENFVDGVYIQSLPAGAKALVYHGRV